MSAFDKPTDKPPTPAEFLAEMRMIVAENGSDHEHAHLEMDALMAETLNQLGYGEGIEVFHRQTKWYA